MSAEEPETVDEYETLLQRLQGEAVESFENHDFEDYRDARRAYSGVLADFNRKHQRRPQWLALAEEQVRLAHELNQTIDTAIFHRRERESGNAEDAG